MCTTLQPPREESPIALAASIFHADMPVPGIVLSLAFLVISLGVHEAAHGWVALKCGDTTARDLGRITLNPVPHIDPVMTIIMPVVLLLTTGFMFGGAKPVPVNFHRLRHPYRDMALVALAGPLSNLLIAAIFLLARKLVVFDLGLWEPGVLGDRVLDTVIVFNLILAVFNMVPIPPLDGSRVMTWLLPASLRRPYQMLEGFGMMLIFFLIFFVPGFQQLIGAGIGAAYRVIHFVVTAGGTW